MELQMAATGWRGRLGSRKEENERKTTEREMRERNERERERERERDYELLDHKTPLTLHGRTYSPALLGNNSLNHKQKRDWREKQQYQPGYVDHIPK